VAAASSELPAACLLSAILFSANLSVEASRLRLLRCLLEDLRNVAVSNGSAATSGCEGPSPSSLPSPVSSSPSPTPGACARRNIAFATGADVLDGALAFGLVADSTDAGGCDLAAADAVLALDL